MDIAILKFTVFACGPVSVGFLVKQIFLLGTSWVSDRVYSPGR